MSDVKRILEAGGVATLTVIQMSRNGFNGTVAVAYSLASDPEAKPFMVSSLCSPLQKRESKRVKANRPAAQKLMNGVGDFANNPVETACNALVLLEVPVLIRLLTANHMAFEGLEAAKKLGLEGLGLDFWAPSRFLGIKKRPTSEAQVKEGIVHVPDGHALISGENMGEVAGLCTQIALDDLVFAKTRRKDGVLAAEKYGIREFSPRGLLEADLIHQLRELEDQVRRLEDHRLRYDGAARALGLTLEELSADGVRKSTVFRALEGYKDAPLLNTAKIRKLWARKTEG